MTWRPWVIAGLLILAFLVNGMLVVQERLPIAEQAPDVRKIEEKLRTMQYLASNRRANFQAMGMSFELAEATANHISRFDRQQEKFERLLDEQAAELVEVFCSTEKVPQPYAALAYLVYEENGARYVIDPSTLRRLERQKWYDASLVPALYDHFERTERRKPDATLMAVGALLLDREEAALDGQAPWSIGLVGTWGFPRLVKQEPRVERLAVEYFGLMHYLTELANTQRGICS